MALQGVVSIDLLLVWKQDLRAVLGLGGCSIDKHSFLSIITCGWEVDRTSSSTHQPTGCLRNLIRWAVCFRPVRLLNL